MADFALPVQTALYAALTEADPPVAEGRVYDYAPDRVKFPYVLIDGGQAIPDDTTTATGFDSGIEEYIDLHVWSRFRGNEEIKRITSRIHDLLHGASLTVPGRASAHVWIDAVRGPIRDPDGISRHSVVTVKIIHRSN